MIMLTKNFPDHNESSDGFKGRGKGEVKNASNNWGFRRVVKVD